jgi:hypothetical protein
MIALPSGPLRGLPSETVVHIKAIFQLYVKYIMNLLQH